MSDADILALINQYENARDSRLVLDRQSATLKKEEEKFKTQLIEKLRARGGALETEHLRAAVEREDKPTCEDWGKLHAYIQEEQAWDLLQKRLTETAVKLRWDDNIDIPGVVKFPTYKLSITKA